MIKLLSIAVLILGASSSFASDITSITCAGKAGRVFCTANMQIDRTGAATDEDPAAGHVSNPARNNDALPGLGKLICARSSMFGDKSHILADIELNRFRILGLVDGFVLTAKDTAVEGRIPQETALIEVESVPGKTSKANASFYDGKKFRALEMFCSVRNEIR